MGLLSGSSISAIFGSVFGKVFEDGVLQKVDKRRLPNGTLSSVVLEEFPILVQLDSVTERMSRAEGAAVTDKRIIILRDRLYVEITSDDLVIARGKSWSLNEVDTDPARSYYEARGSLQRSVEDP